MVLFITFGDFVIAIISLPFHAVMYVPAAIMHNNINMQVRILTCMMMPPVLFIIPEWTLNGVFSGCTLISEKLQIQPAPFSFQQARPGPHLLITRIKRISDMMRQRYVNHPHGS
jgi:hypothetical protein